MAGCRIVNESVATAVSDIETTSRDFKTAGDDFITSLKNAISEMEGETKDALVKFIDSDVNKFVVEDLPSAIKSMSEVLEANRTNFVDTDKGIADNIG
ncbi:MAG: hypothetical protein FWD27_08675 [Coriobacteriia bacterium]|nr:hypothetical protein [Coriobacteriia bacterium]